MQNKTNNSNHSHLSALLWSIAIGVICFAAHILICEGSDASPALIGLILLGAYIAAVAVISISLYRYQRAKELADAHISSNSNALRDLIAQINTAILLSDGNGKIIWCNNKLESEFNFSNSLIGTSMYSFCELTEEKLIAGNENGGTELFIGGKHYLVSCFKVKLQIKSHDDVRDFYMTVFDDITELVKTKDKMERSLPAIAYIVVDNLEELAQYVKISYRQATNEIETILKEWAESLDGVLREYDRDRYILMLTNEKLNEWIEDNFTILDKIRNVRLADDDSSMPITVSMGISRAPRNEESFDLTAIEKDASAALDMALQRGGDQVAIKDENGMEFFGGRTKTIQKRTRVRARVIANKLCTLIAGSSRVLVMGHKNPDFDSIGACVGIARLSMFCGVAPELQGVNRKTQIS